MVFENKISQSDCSDCTRPDRGPNSDYFPDVTLETHEKQRVLFYSDLLAGKTVMVNFMSVASEAEYPVMDHLLGAARLLGDRLGRDVFMYTITLQPEWDTAHALQLFSQRYQTPPGWLFLTGDPFAVHKIHARFYAGGGATHRMLNKHQDQTSDCSLGLIRYGNEAVGVWGAVPCRTSPEWIVKRLDWITPPPASSGKPRRRGPVPGTAWYAEPR